MWREVRWCDWWHMHFYFVAFQSKSNNSFHFIVSIFFSQPYRWSLFVSFDAFEWSGLFKNKMTAGQASQPNRNHGLHLFSALSASSISWYLLISMFINIPREWTQNTKWNINQHLSATVYAVAHDSFYKAASHFIKIPIPYWPQYIFINIYNYFIK